MQTMVMVERQFLFRNLGSLTMPRVLCFQVTTKDCNVHEFHMLLYLDCICFWV